MDPRLQEALNGAGENYIAPFFWQHGEEDGILQEEIEKIYQSGIRAVCVESRRMRASAALRGGRIWT